MEASNKRKEREREREGEREKRQRQNQTAKPFQLISCGNRNGFTFRILKPIHGFNVKQIKDADRNDKGEEYES